MIEFDKGQHMAMIQLSLEGVSVKLNLDMKDIKSEPLLQGTRLGSIPKKSLKLFLEYADHRFRLDPKSPVPWKEQFCRFLGKECEAFLGAARTMTPAQLKELVKGVREANMSLVKAAGVMPDDYKRALQAVSFSYHDGFNHFTRDDDFIAVRCGNKIVSIIALPGNDHNEAKKFLKMGGDRILEPQNVAKLRKAVAAARRMKMSELLNRKSVVKREGLTITKQ